MVSRARRIPAKSLPLKNELTWKSRFLVVKIAHNEKKHNRYAVVVSKTAEPKAVIRHLLKRYIISIIDRLPERGVDMLFLVQPAIKSFSAIDKKKNLQQALVEFLKKQ